MRTFGYPRMRPEAGLPGELAFYGATAAAGYDQLALHSEEATLGFSGAPIWDPELGVVVGMVKSIARGDPGQRLGNTAIGVPAEEATRVAQSLVLANLCGHDSHGMIRVIQYADAIKDGRLKVHRIVAATDPGYAVNPAQIERQVAGSFVYGLTALFMGECTVKAGRIEQENFDSYDMMRIAQMPKVETILVPSGGFWGGVGEPTICVAAPAVLNAITAATGKRYRTFPLKHHGLTMA